MVGVAVNVTLLPAQIVVAVLEILTEDGIVGFTVMVIALLAAVDEVTQLNELVIKHVITSPDVSELELYVALVTPVDMPFLYQW